jgi:amidohydrolase
MELREKILNYAETLMEEMVVTRRHLHQHPELSFNEEKTSAHIRELLDGWGVEYDYPFVQHGILARIEGKQPSKKVVALRSDMDALPITEQTGLQFASQNPGVMHACGHDIHMTSLLGAIRIIKAFREHLEGTLLFIFQPGEEKLPGGAKLMMEEGLFSKYKPDMVIAQHVLPEMDAGTVGFRSGPYMASGDEIYITVKGKGGHGALPETINDPVLMASHMLISLQQEINRKSPKGVPTVLSFGKFVADGAVNIIPDQVFLEGTFRTMNEPWRKEAHALIQQITKGIASGMGGEVDLEIRHGYPALANDPSVTTLSKKYATELLGEDHVQDMDIRMTTEDFGWFAAQYPAMMYRLGVKTPGSAEILPLHTSRFRADESALKTGMSLLAWLGIHLAS